MKKIKVNDVELAYRDEGSGKPIVFLHAFPLNQTMWDEQVAEFASSHRVITFDWRGFGESSMSSTHSSLSVFAEDLAELLNLLEIEKATICGLSMGGYATFAFYRKYAERVNALILCDTRATADNDEGKRGRYEMAELARTQGTSAISEKMIPKLLGETTLKNRPNVLYRVRSMIEAAQPEGIAQALIGMEQRDNSTVLLPLISCPTLVDVGKEDNLTPPADAEKLAQSITASRLEVINDAGHLSNLEQPLSFNQAISKFLNKY
jgi:pimeloyl-ACP methyl ester carboxylesterase